MDKLETFVLMPFNENFTDVYKLGIKETVENNNIKVSRLDEEIFDTNMVQEIYDKIQKADFIIADMSTRNPNVFYEVGYADALDKKLILLTNNQDDIPFDLLQRQHIIYKNLTDLKTQLSQRIERIKEDIINQKEALYDISFKTTSSYLEKESYTDKAYLTFNLLINNTSKKNINIKMIDLFMATNWEINTSDGALNEEITTQDGQIYKRFRFSPNIKEIPNNDHITYTLKGVKDLFTIKEDERKDSYTLSGHVKLNITINGKRIEKHFSMEEECSFIPF